MRHLISTILLLLMFCLVSLSQSITTAEYFFDTDPGIGNGMPLSVIAGDEWEFTIPVTGLDSGFHKLSIRIEQGDTAWSFTESRMFYIKSPSEPEIHPQLVNGEYFFDTDPGIGNGTSFSYNQGDTIDITEIVETTGLIPGFHHLSFRFINENGEWSHSESRVIYIPEETENELFVIAGGEYFFDTDPGIGNGTTFSLEEADTINFEQLIDVSGLTEGFHKLSVRVFYENGTSGFSESRLFYIKPASPVAEIPNLVAMEYCIDDTLGNGNEIPVPVMEGDTIDVLLEIPLTGTTLGKHLISFRVMNAEGIFSKSATDTFNIQMIEDLPPEAPNPPEDITVECASEIPAPEDLTAIDDIDGEITVSPVDETTPGGCPNKFTVLRTWTFVDSNENSVSISQTITVWDDQAPELVSDTPLDLTFSCGSELPPVANLTAVDNCDGEITVSPTINTTPGDCPNHFSEKRTWNFQDACGNTTVVHQNISVFDNVSPIAHCNNITVQLDENGNANIAATDIDNGSFDACGEISLFLDKYSFSCADVGDKTVLLSVKDDCGNISQCEATVTVEDIIPPEISCIPTESFYVDANQTYYTVQGTELDADATDACGIASLSYALSGVTSGSGESLSDILLNPGMNIIKWTAKDENENLNTCTTNVTVEKKRPASIVYEGNIEGQYSDVANVQAVLTDDISGLGIKDKTIIFQIGNQSVTAVTGDEGIASATLVLDQKPAETYSVSATFLEDDNFLGCIISEPFTIDSENAELDYNGTELTATSSVSNLKATIDLRAVLRDMGDGFRGDITNATVQFVNLDNNTDISGWMPVVDLIDPFTGVVSLPWFPELGKNENSETYTVGIKVNNYYEASDEVIITVYLPSGDFITGGGNIKPTSSFGLYDSDPGTKTNFGFNIKFNKTGKNLQGKMNFIWRSDGRIYQAKSNATLSLGVNAFNEDKLLAEFTSKCNVKDISDPLYPIDLGGNKIMQVTLTDRGEPGYNDQIGFTLWDDNILLYSSSWNGLQTDEMLLNGGNLVIHSGFTIEPVKKAEIITDNTPELKIFNISIYPNPTSGIVNLELSNYETPYTIELINIAGQVVIQREIRSTSEELDLHDLPRGIYLIKVSNQFSSKTEKLIIQ